MAGKISVVINVVEAEIGTLPRVLASIKKLSDEIVVVDMSSSGIPSDLVKKYGLKVYNHKFVNYVEPARNFGVYKSKGDWVLVLDPDEEVPRSLGRKLKKLVKEDKADYYRLPRKNIVFGKWLKYSRWWPDLNIRFFKKGAVTWTEEIHGVPITQGTGVDLPAKEKLAISHYHYVSISQYVERLNRYTEVQAESRLKNGYKFDWRDLIKKPANEFLSRYFAGQGYKDGLHGLAIALMQATSEIVLYLKVWERQKFAEKDLKIKEVVKEMKKAQKDLRWWQLGAAGGLIGRVWRKFKPL